MNATEGHEYSNKCLQMIECYILIVKLIRLEEGVKDGSGKG